MFIAKAQISTCPANITYGKNIICNGNFESGDSCFSKGYIPFSQSPVGWSNPGYYLVGSSGAGFNPAFSGTNRTPGGNKFLMIDGSCTPGMIVWEQTVDILPNTYYYFSAWLSSLLAQFPAQLQFSINGTMIGSPFNAPSTTNIWQAFTEVWHSGTLSGPVKISIVNLTTAGCTNGNDFGIDDISFIPGCKFGLPGPEPELGPDIYICPGETLTLNSGIPPPHTNMNFLWNTGAKTSSITVTAPGKYSVCVDSAGSCVRSDVVEVIAADKIKAGLWLNLLSGCSPLTVFAKSTTAGSPLTFEWYIDGNLSSHTTGTLPGQTFTATGSSAETHTIRLVAKNKCGNSDDTTVTVTVYPAPDILAGPDRTICNGESVTLSASGGGSYSWIPSTGLSCTNCPNPVASPGHNVTYTVNVLSPNGCSATDTVTVNVIYNLNISMRDTTVCAGEAVTLNTGMSSTATYQWTPSTGLSCTTCPNPVASPTTTTNYQVSVTQGNCNGNGNVRIEIKNCGPLINVNKPSICLGSNATLTASISAGGVPPYTFYWQPGGLTGPSITVSPPSTSTYTITVQDANGQTGTTAATVTVFSSPAVAASPSTICPGETSTLTASGGVSYTWSQGVSPVNGNPAYASPQVSSTYTITGTSAEGCTASNTLTVLVHQAPAITVGDLLLCKDSTGMLSASGGVSYTWLPGNTTSNPLTVSPLTTGVSTYTIIGASVQGCSNSTTAKVTANDCSRPHVTLNGSKVCIGSCYNLTAVAIGGAGVLTYSWTPNIGSGPGPFTLCPTSLSSYTVVVTDANGNSDTGTAILTVHLLPAVTCSNDTVCEGSPAMLNAAGALTYTWAPSGSSGSSLTLNAAAAGSYTVTGTDANGCSNSAAGTVVTKALPLLQASSDTVCAGNRATLAVSGALSYTWMPGNLTGDSIIQSPPFSTSYTVTGTGANGCSNTAAAAITVNPAPVVKVSDVTICSGSGATLTASGAASYTWLPGGSTANPFVTSPPASSSYTVTGASAYGCTSTATAGITVDPRPLIAFSADTLKGCVPLTISYRNNTNAILGSTCTWEFGDGSTSTECMPSYIYDKPGTWTVKLTVTTPSGCSDSLIKTDLITSLPVPVADFTANPKQSDMMEPTIKFSSHSQGDSMRYWCFGDGTCDSSNIPFITHTYSDSGTYKVCLTVENAYGCNDDICQDVIIHPVWSFFIPNAFSPNGDGKNEIFNGAGNNLKEYQMYIFDRWGNLVYETNSLARGWDGRAGTDIAQEDVYVYKVILLDVFGRKHMYTGIVTLLR